MSCTGCPAGTGSPYRRARGTAGPTRRRHFRSREPTRYGVTAIERLTPLGRGHGLQFARTSAFGHTYSEQPMRSLFSLSSS